MTTRPNKDSKKLQETKSDSNEWKVWYDAELKTACHWSRGKNDKDLASESADEMRRLVREHPDIFGILVDVSDVTTVDVDGRKAYGEFVRAIKKKVAFYGANAVMRVVIKFVFAAFSRIDNMKIFATKKEALDWLRAIQ